jgi:hypothetical protein
MQPPLVNLTKIFSSPLTLLRNKLACLSSANFIALNTLPIMRLGYKIFYSLVSQLGVCWELYSLPMTNRLAYSRGESVATRNFCKNYSTTLCGRVGEEDIFYSIGSRIEWSLAFFLLATRIWSFFVKMLFHQQGDQKIGKNCPIFHQVAKISTSNLLKPLGTKLQTMLWNFLLKWKCKK